MNTLNLVKKLIQIPSYVDETCDEKRIGAWVYEYLEQFPWLTVEKQPVVNGRYNIIVQDAFPTRLLLTGHMDTVQPKDGWLTDQYNPVVQQGKLYGLGAADMKSNVGAMLSSLNNFQQTKGFMLLLYVDEEYDFLGIKKFIQEYQMRVRPAMIISGDGNDMAIGNGCRGLIEITFITRGLSGHASNPQQGKNAVLRSTDAIKKFCRYIKENFSHQQLGSSTCNLAYMQGGLYRGEKDGNILFGREGNNIADITEFVLDIRTASETLDAQQVIFLLKMFLEKNGLTIEKTIIRHNEKPWITPKSQLQSIEKCIKTVRYRKLGHYGYSDMQMMWEAFKQVPCFTFGAGNGKTCHKVNEYAYIKDINKLTKIYTSFIAQFGGGVIKTLC